MITLKYFLVLLVNSVIWNWNIKSDLYFKYNSMINNWNKYSVIIVLGFNLYNLLFFSFDLWFILAMLFVSVSVIIKNWSDYVNQPKLNQHKGTPYHDAVNRSLYSITSPDQLWVWGVDCVPDAVYDDPGSFFVNHTVHTPQSFVPEMFF